MFGEASKYVVWEGENDGFIFATIFHPYMDHDSIGPLRGFYKPIAAGFFRFDAMNKIVVFGESVTLKLGPSKNFDDRKVIARALCLDPDEVVSK